MNGHPVMQATRVQPPRLARQRQRIPRRNTIPSSKPHKNFTETCRHWRPPSLPPSTRSNSRYWTNVTQMAQAALANWQSIATQISSIIAYENTITAKNGVAQSQPLAAQTVTGSSISTANPNTSITAGSPGGNTAPSAPAITVNVTAPSTDAGDIVNAARNALQVAGNSVSAGSLY